MASFILHIQQHLQQVMDHNRWSICAECYDFSFEANKRILATDEENVFHKAPVVGGENPLYVEDK